MAPVIVGFSIICFYPIWCKYETLPNGYYRESSYENNSLILWYFSQTVIILTANINSYMELSQNIICLRQTVSRLPNFELLIMQREQKFIHPSLTQPHLVPLHLWILEHSPWTSASNTA